MRSRLSQRLNALRESARWRGSLITVLLVLRKLVRPALYFDVYRIFETDISQTVPQPYGEVDVEVKIFSPDDDLAITDDKISAELERDQAQLRFARGDLVGIAFLKERPVGYMWISLSSGVELGLDTDTYWIIRASEAVRYGSFVLPAFRGRGIHSCLNTAITTYLRRREVTRVLGAVSILNPQSMRLPKHYNRAISMTIFVARVRGIGWTIRKSFRAPLGSRFSWPHH